MKLLMLAVWTALVVAQTTTAPVPGVITPVKTSSIMATAGALKCTVSTATAGATVNVYCYNGTILVFNATATITGAPGVPGTTVSFNQGPDAVGVLIQRTSAGVQWQITANGTFKQDNF